MTHFFTGRGTGEDLETAARIRDQIALQERLAIQADFEQLQSLNVQLAGISSEKVAALPAEPVVNRNAVAAIAAGVVFFILIS